MRVLYRFLDLVYHRVIWADFIAVESVDSGTASMVSRIQRAAVRLNRTSCGCENTSLEGSHTKIVYATECSILKSKAQQRDWLIKTSMCRAQSEVS